MEPRQRRHGSDWGLAVKATAVKTHRQRNAMKEIDDTGERRRSDDEMATVRPPPPNHNPRSQKSSPPPQGVRITPPPIALSHLETFNQASLSQRKKKSFVVRSIARSSFVVRRVLVAAASFSTSHCCSLSFLLCSFEDHRRRFVQLGVVRIGTRGDSNCSRLTSGYAPFRSKLLPFVDDYCFRKLGSCCCINSKNLTSSEERTEETTFPFFPLRFPMVDPSRTIDVEKLISWCDDLVKILPDQHDIDNLALCLQRTTSLSSTCNSDLNHVRNLLQDVDLQFLFVCESDCQKKIDACKQKKEEARCESASDAELDLLQRELDEELEKENFLKEEFR
ncbi:hypothetical protein HN51_066623 [Arachis hypogaea]